MICLDTNYLIMGLARGTREAERLLSWSGERETFCASSVVWYEFLCGPVSDVQRESMRALLAEIVPFDDAVAAEAARLFNATGRSRALRVDAMIAATAVIKDLPLATRNVDDFARFADHGLSLIELT